MAQYVPHICSQVVGRILFKSLLKVHALSKWASANFATQLSSSDGTFFPPEGVVQQKYKIRSLNTSHSKVRFNACLILSLCA